MQHPLPFTEKISQKIMSWRGKKNPRTEQAPTSETFELALSDWQSQSTQQQAERLLADKDQLEDFLVGIEAKLRKVPFAGEQLSMIPALVSMLRSYVKKDYREIPKGVLLAAVGALIYFLSPLDALPDFFTGFGLLDDVFVLNACLKLIKSDVEDYRAWQAHQNSPED